MKTIQVADTFWPIPDSWEEHGDGVYQGDEGILTVVIEDGELIDPARCRTANEARPADWHLCQTSNGTAIAATYSEADALVQVFAVRADGREFQELPFDALPEVRATYVLVEDAESIVRAVKKHLGHRTIKQNEFGTLDAFGHAAMGPVPILGAWAPVDETQSVAEIIDRGRGHASYQTLVGGGWIMLADEPRCCGVTLRPLPWRDLSRQRAEEFLNDELSPKGFTVRSAPSSGARVWGYTVGERGHSFTAHDSSGQLRAVDAFWQDVFSQAWRLHYWLDARHGGNAELHLSKQTN